jgi:hypothetical protein
VSVRFVTETLGGMARGRADGVHHLRPGEPAEMTASRRPAPEMRRSSCGGFLRGQTPQRLF